MYLNIAHCLKGTIKKQEGKNIWHVLQTRHNCVMEDPLAVGEILEVLSAAKEAVRNTYRQNDTITYVISIVNAGTLAYTGLTITDNLGA